MLIWNLYFIVKIALWSQGLVGFVPWLNLLVMIAAIATSVLGRQQPTIAKFVHGLVIFPMALVLVLHEAGLVVSIALIQQAQALTSFSQEYLLELIERSVPIKFVWIGLGTAALILVFNRYIRVSAWVLVTLGAITANTAYQQWQAEQSQLLVASELGENNPVRKGDFPAERVALGPEGFETLQAVLERGQKSDTSKPSQFLEKFYKEQSQLLLPSPLLVSPPDFDIIVIHVCSMAWADIKASQQAQHPVIKDADFILNNFNTVASYSGPAVIRLLRSSCGQKTHNDIYLPIKPECSLFETLAQSGYSLQMGLNHDGRFDDFKALIKENFTRPSRELVKYDDITVGGIAFDGSTLAADSEYLSTWWNKRQALGGSPVAMYYNTISLHDGNKLPGSKLNSLESYPIRAENLLDAVQDLIEKIKKTKGHALVVMVPEHGAGITGEYGQLPGLREIPTPAITLAPAIVHWVAPNYVREDIYKFPIQINSPTSFAALTEFITRWISLPPDARNKPAWNTVTANLPTTHFVAQQGDITVLEDEGQYLLKTPGTPWLPLEQRR